MWSLQGLGCTGGIIWGSSYYVCLQIANCLKLNAQNLEIYKAPRVGVTLTRPTLMGSMCVLLQPWPCRLAPRSGSCLPHPPPHPLLLMGPSLYHLVVFSSHGNPWRPHPSGLLIPEAQRGGQGGHPNHPTMERYVVGCCYSPWPQRPRFPYSEAPGGPKLRGPAASPNT